MYFYKLLFKFSKTDIMRAKILFLHFFFIFKKEERSAIIMFMKGTREHFESFVMHRSRSQKFSSHNGLTDVPQFVSLSLFVR